MEAILQFNQVNFTYPGTARKTLKDVGVTFEIGKLYVIYGPSGSGKTTTLAMAGGLDVPDKGEILFKGEDIQKIGLRAHRRDHVAFIFQNYNLIQYMTALENVTVAMDIAKGGNTNEKKANAMRILKSLGLEEDEAKRNVLRLSGGQRQRVAIARALSSSAKIVLADEPTGNLDPDTAAEIVELLQKLAHEHGKCVIAVSHSPELARQADVAYSFQKGALVPRTQGETGEPVPADGD